MKKKKLHRKLRRTYTYRIVPAVNPVCDLCVPGAWQHSSSENVVEQATPL